LCARGAPPRYSGPPMSYRVELPAFSGPLDLLLHLVKQAEVDIHDIPIATILDRYLEHLCVLEHLDLADIGDFLVMASALMEIKSRELLPKEEIDLEEDLDPRDDLIRRLLEYKRYRDLSRRLERSAGRRAQMAEAGVEPPDELRETDEEQDWLDLGEIEVWALTDAFARLLAETGTDRSLHVTVERRSITFYVGRILERVKSAGELRFEALFEPAEGRAALIGTFQALLELMKQGFMRAHQERCLGPILVVFVGPQDLTVEQVAQGASAFDAETAAEEEAEAAAD
jgi:segregation and condensation protein A